MTRDGATKVSKELLDRVTSIRWERKESGALQPKKIDIGNLFSVLEKLGVDIEGFNRNTLLSTSTVEADSVLDPEGFEIRFQMKRPYPEEKRYNITHGFQVNGGRRVELPVSYRFVETDSIFNIKIYRSGRFFVEHIPENLKHIKNDNELILKLISAVLECIT